MVFKVIETSVVTQKVHNYARNCIPVKVFPKTSSCDGIGSFGDVVSETVNFDGSSPGSVGLVL